MRNHNNRRRHRNNNKGQEEDVSMSVRPEESLNDASYSRSHRQNDNYRPQTGPNRNRYDLERDGSSSRTHADAWRQPDGSHDRYDYPPTDVYHRGGREEYTPPRENEGWTGRRSNDNHYTQPPEEWPQRYDRDPGYSSGPYAESSSWPHTSNYDTPYEAWPRDQRHPVPVVEERYPERDMGWVPPVHRRAAEDGPQWKKDNGWEARGRGGAWGDARPNDSLEHPVHEDRTWEPAPSWQGRQHQNQGKKNGNRNNQSAKRNKQNKKNQPQVQNQNGQQKRDWRNDDGDLNNWRRRDVPNTSHSQSPKQQRRKHARSPSRSRSPPESFSSRRYSRSRSRSISPSPSVKRRRRDALPAHSPSPDGRVRRNSGSRRSLSPYSSPPRNYPSGERARSRSVSSASTMSRSSRSRSPGDRPRAVHRLPQATVVSSISPFANKTGKKARNRNGKQSRKDTHNVTGAPQSLGGTASQEEMPPPTMVPPSRSPLPSQSEYLAASFLPSSATKPDMMKPSRITPGKAGFKPIGTNPTLKRFFTTDDDEIEDIPLPPSLPQKPQFSATPKPATRNSEGWTPASVPLSVDPPPSGFVQSSQAHQPNGSSSQTPTLGAMESRTTLSSPREASGRPTPSTAPEEVAPPRHRNHDFGRAERPEVIAPDAMDSTESSRGQLYAIVTQVGEGTFGKVYKARNTVSKVFVALKRIRMETERDGFPVTAMREIKLLQSLKQDNIIQLFEIMVSRGAVYMVFEYMDHDLTGILSQTQFSFTDAHLKSLCRQMLAGLAYLHHKGVIHRDIKGSNILINNLGQLKLGDFGLARFYQKRRRADYTNRVITLWYRPPELLFGATVYGPEVDMWSAGCIMLELFTKRPVFQGNDEIHQLDVIYKIIGTPSPERWRGLIGLPWYELIKPREVIQNNFRALFQKWMSSAALDLAEKLLTYDPSQRFTAIQAMAAPYFTQELPREAMPTGLAGLEGEWHELETKRERAKKRRKTENAVQ
ncbi:hypothetical protein HGRIS_009574 [Hohenbuehelia grisea]|uniref:Protein kinase domain-containing protein n=1 Tax=Hohenbuehelia grisea TaxID=104357 RepID=A0ABR3J1Z6_9AGAR